MKKYVIAVVATIATLFLLAQTGLLAPFGIKQLSFTRENGDKDAPQQQNEEFTDTVNDLSYKFKTEGKSFYVYKNGGWQEELMTGVNIGASEPAARAKRRAARARRKSPRAKKSDQRPTRWK